MGTKRRLKANVNAAGIVPVLEAFEEFVSQKEAENKSEKTIHNYKQSFSFLRDYYGWDGDTEFNEISSKTFYQWIQHELKEELRPASINHYLRDLRTFFNWAIDKEYMRPLESTFKWQISGQEELPKVLDDEEVAKLLEKPDRRARATEWRCWAVVNLILATGVRADTVVNIAIDDVVFNREEIHIRKTKNKKASILPLSPALANVLKEYIRIWRSDPESEWLFPDLGENKLTYNALRQSYVKYCEIRDVKNTSIHALRHTYAKGFILNGGNPLTLKNILGHSSMRMTEHYVKLFSADLKRDYEDYSPLDVIQKKKRRTQKLKKNM